MESEWPKPNTEIPKPVAETEQVEREQNIEQELSPEQIERIMEKVQDIDQPGTAYRCVNIHDEEFTSPNILKSVFTDGFLGSNQKNRKGEEQIDRMPKEKWAKGVRRDNSGCVQFNIVGRMEEIKKMKEQALQNIGKTEWVVGGHRTYMMTKPTSAEKIIKSPEINLNYYSFGHQDGESNRTYVLFDISDFTEIEADSYRLFDRKDVKEKNRSYYKLGYSTEDGFGLSYRVAPRFFSGVVLRASTRDDYFDQDNEAINNETKEILKLYKETNLYLPIYNALGELVWPKQMSHEEVKKFVAERDAQKGNNENSTEEK